MVSRRNLFTGSYPTTLKFLGGASVGWLTCTLAFGLYELYLGVPLSEINRVFLPIGLAGLLLMLVALGWKALVDRKSILAELRA